MELSYFNKKKLTPSNQKIPPINNIVLTGGGTGGHVIPNLCLIPHLQKHFNIFYIGSSLIEKELILKQKNVLYKQISTPPKFNRNKPINNLILPFKLINCIIESKKLLKQIKPKVVFSKGGFVSVPVCIAAYLLKIPIISHESDLSLGLANKLIYKLSKKFLTTFAQTALNLKKATATGSPIRDNLFLGKASKALEQAKLLPTKPTILIMGGSTGAKSLNEQVYKILHILTKKYNVIHIVGKNKLNSKIVYNNYYQTEFIYNIQDFLALSDMVISRAGSNAICELLALKKPMLLIPLSNSSSRGDQVANANYFNKLNIAIIQSEKTLTPEIFLNKIEELNKKKNSLIQKMNSIPSINGTMNIVHEILKFKN